MGSDKTKPPVVAAKTTTVHAKTAAVSAKTAAAGGSPSVAAAVAATGGTATVTKKVGMGYVTTTTTYKPDPRHAENYRPHIKDIVKAFDDEALKRICLMGETEFAGAYGMEMVDLPAQGVHKAGFYAYKNNGSPILAVAHLDTVIASERRMCNFVNTAAGPMVFSGSLDDRLGAYIILELLPKLGITFDWLLTTNEEIGDSTALDFTAPFIVAENQEEDDNVPPMGEMKPFNWLIEFDRGGTDVVMYQYDDWETDKLVKECGAKVGRGSCSDISYLEHLGVKAFNWGVGYQNYHGPKSHAYLYDTFKMVGHFLDFYAVQKDVVLPHKPKPVYSSSKWSKSKDGPTDRGGLITPDTDPYSQHGWWDHMENVSLDEIVNKLNEDEIRMRGYI